MQAAVFSVHQDLENRRIAEAPLGFIGVDGGATRCRVRVRDSEGRALAEALGEASANVHVDFRGVDHSSALSHGRRAA